MLMPNWREDLPKQARVIRGDNCDFQSEVFTQLSLKQTLSNAKDKDGKDVLWTTDVEVELPIRLIDDGDYGMKPPVTIVEAFANVMRQCADLPALYWKPVHVVSAHRLKGCQGTASTDEMAETTTAERQDNTPTTTTDGWPSTGTAPDADPDSERLSIQIVSVAAHWESMTWQTYWNETCTVAKALIASDVGPFDRTSVMGFNAPEWNIAHFGSIFANAVPVSMYATNSDDVTAFIVAEADVKVAFVDVVQNAEKLISAKKSGRCSSLTTVVIYGESVPKGLTSLMDDLSIIPWEQFMARGADVLEKALTTRMEKQRPGGCAEIVYTSGTTGFPKGVMLSHDNLLWTAETVARVMHFTTADHLVSYLPLSHIAPQMIDLFLPIVSGMKISFAQPDALKSSLLTTLKEVQPTWMFSVPRVWEKMEERIKEKFAELSGGRKTLLEYGRRVCAEGCAKEMQDETPRFLYYLLKKLIFDKLRHEIGLGKCKAFATGAAPISKATQEFFMSLCIPICDLFGMTECSGPQYCNIPYPLWFKIQTSGRALPATDNRVFSKNAKGLGELCFRGRNVFMGYFKNEKATREAIDEFGFLHTGDQGYIDDDGFAVVTGRFKELLITAGGENIPPMVIENVVKEEMPFVSNCQVIGDRRKYLTLLVTLKSTPDAEGHPTNNLTTDLHTYLADRGSRAKTTHDAQSCPVIKELINGRLEKVNRRAISRAQMVQKWRIIPLDFTIYGGEMTPTLKLKRNAVIAKYIDTIEEMYNDASTPATTAWEKSRI